MEIGGAGFLGGLQLDAHGFGVALVHEQLALEGQKPRARDAQPMRARGQGQIAAEARNTINGDVGVRLVDVELDVSADQRGLGWIFCYLDGDLAARSVGQGDVA